MALEKSGPIPLYKRIIKHDGKNRTRHKYGQQFVSTKISQTWLIFLGTQ